MRIKRYCKREKSLLCCRSPQTRGERGVWLQGNSAACSLFFLLRFAGGMRSDKGLMPRAAPAGLRLVLARPRWQQAAFGGAYAGITACCNLQSRCRPVFSPCPCRALRALLRHRLSSTRVQSQD